VRRTAGAASAAGHGAAAHLVVIDHPAQVLASLALPAHRRHRQLGDGTGEQRAYGLQKLVALDRAAGKLIVERDEICRGPRLDGVEIFEVGAADLVLEDL